MNGNPDKLRHRARMRGAAVCLLLLLGAANAPAVLKINKWFPGRCEGRVKHGAKLTVAVTNGWVIFRGATPRTHIQFTTLRNVNLLVNAADKLSFKRSRKQRGGIVSNLWFGTSASLMQQTNDLAYTFNQDFDLLLDFVDVRSIRAHSLRRVRLGALHQELAGGCLRGLQLKVRDIMGGTAPTTRLCLGAPGFLTPLASIQSGTRIEWVDARHTLPSPRRRNPRVIWRGRYYANGDILVRDDQRGTHQGKNVLLSYSID
jgi:hypothetical protein